MTDPNETANLVGEITEAWREHLAKEAAEDISLDDDEHAIAIGRQATPKPELSMGD
jgi:hypothetical protein